jgi:transposase
MTLFPCRSYIVPDVSQKRSTSWHGYKVHLTETCDPELPRLITHVATTLAPVSDDTMTPRIHQELKDGHLLLGHHLVDTGTSKQNTW